jgi:hypothetical protein
MFNLPPNNLNSEEIAQIEMILMRIISDFGIGKLFSSDSTFELLVDIIEKSKWIKHITDANQKTTLTNPISEVNTKLEKLIISMQKLDTQQLQVISAHANSDYQVEKQWSSVENFQFTRDVSLPALCEILHRAKENLESVSNRGSEPWKRYLAKALTELLGLHSIPLKIRQSTEEKDLPVHYQFVREVSLRIFRTTIAVNTISDVTNEVISLKY